jgi:hypothetical protein
VPLYERYAHATVNVDSDAAEVIAGHISQALDT